MSTHRDKLWRNYSIYIKIITRQTMIAWNSTVSRWGRRRNETTVSRRPFVDFRSNTGTIRNLNVQDHSRFGRGSYRITPSPPPYDGYCLRGSFLRITDAIWSKSRRRTRAGNSVVKNPSRYLALQSSRERDRPLSTAPVEYHKSLGARYSHDVSDESVFCPRLRGHSVECTRSAPIGRSRPRKVPKKRKAKAMASPARFVTDRIATTRDRGRSENLLKFGRPRH